MNSEQMNQSRLQLRIDWSELDLFGHVNNVAIFKYIQAARVNFWEKLELSKMYKEQNIFPMLVSCTCDFSQELHYPGHVIIDSTIDFIGNTSFGFIHSIKNEKGDTVAQGKDVMVLFDAKDQQKVQFPENLRLKLK